MSRYVMIVRLNVQVMQANQSKWKRKLQGMSVMADLATLLAFIAKDSFFIFLFVIYETLDRCKHKSQWNTIHYVYLNEFRTPLFDKGKTVLEVTPKLSNLDLIYISI